MYVSRQLKVRRDRESNKVRLHWSLCNVYRSAIEVERRGRERCRARFLFFSFPFFCLLAEHGIVFESTWLLISSFQPVVLSISCRCMNTSALPPAQHACKSRLALVDLARKLGKIGSSVSLVERASS